jgi:hypothetical protein
LFPLIDFICAQIAAGVRGAAQLHFLLTITRHDSQQLQVMLVDDVA